MVALLSSPEHLAALREEGARKRREVEEAERRRVEDKKTQLELGKERNRKVEEKRRKKEMEDAASKKKRDEALQVHNFRNARLPILIFIHSHHGTYILRNYKNFKSIYILLHASSFVYAARKFYLHHHTACRQLCALGIIIPK